MDREVIEIELTAEERVLILQYGYPFEGIEQSLKACQDSTGIEPVPIDPFELERLIGDLTISINDMQPGSLQNALLDVCDRLEAASDTVTECSICSDLPAPSAARPCRLPSDRYHGNAGALCRRVLALRSADCPCSTAAPATVR